MKSKNTKLQIDHLLKELEEIEKKAIKHLRNKYTKENTQSNIKNNK